MSTQEAPDEQFCQWAETLELSVSEASAVRRTGVIARETRGRNSQVFKLYFRIAGRRKSKYLGTNEQAIMAFREILQAFREQREALRSLSNFHDSLNRSVRASRARLRLLLLERGFYFHGMQIRRKRCSQ